MANSKIAASSIKVTIQNGTERTLLATWACSNTNLDHYEVRWQYTDGSKRNGSLVWYEPEIKTTTVKNSTYDAPTNAKEVRISVKPISKTYEDKTDKKGTVTRNYWEFDWSGLVTITLSGLEPIPTPAVPAVPTVVITGNRLTASVNVYDTPTESIEFEVYDTIKGKTIYSNTVDVKAHYASITINVPVGGTYKVRCRAISTSKKSAWSEYSGTDTTVPFKPDSITSCKAMTATSVMLEWSSSKNATGYVVEYTDDESYFDVSTDLVKSTTVEAPNVKVLISGLDTGKRWFFRVKATNEKGSSGWTNPVSIATGSAPEAPTTWSDTTVVILGDDIILHWIHNTSDNSDQTQATIQTYKNGVAETLYPIAGTIAIKTITTTGYSDGDTITWKVRTKGISDTWSAWSTVRTIKVYIAPTVTIDAGFQNGMCIGYPLNITLNADPDTQSVIGCTLSISANESYDTIDNVGNTVPIVTNQIIFYKNLDYLANTMTVSLTPGDVNLDSSISYKITASVTMINGLSATSSLNFYTNWAGSTLYPELGIGINPYELSAMLLPGCTDENGNQLSGVSLSVYRREYNGEFTLISDKIQATDRTTVIDPHPALDFARYRVVAQLDATGEMNYVDIPGVPVDESAVIIQWNDKWSNFNGYHEDPFVEPTSSSSMLRLPYNIDVSDSNNMEVALVNYIGRKRPVSYYGTQLGETSTWSVEIRKEDADTLYAIRRLAIWTDDVYVREPSGSGYWANVKVSLNQTHNDTTIPVSFAITRVEGGI